MTQLLLNTFAHLTGPAFQAEALFDEVSSYILFFAGALKWLCFITIWLVLSEACTTQDGNYILHPGWTCSTGTLMDGIIPWRLEERIHGSIRNLWTHNIIVEPDDIWKTVRDASMFGLVTKWVWEEYHDREQQKLFTDVPAKEMMKRTTFSLNMFMDPDNGTTPRRFAMRTLHQGPTGQGHVILAIEAKRVGHLCPSCTLAP